MSDEHWANRPYGAFWVRYYREAGPWRGLAEVRRLNARIPASLKRRMDGSLLALADSRRDVSARVVLAALVWRHVVSRDEDARRFARLVDIVGAYLRS